MMHKGRKKIFRKQQDKWLINNNTSIRIPRKQKARKRTPTEKIQQVYQHQGYAFQNCITIYIDYLYCPCVVAKRSPLCLETHRLRTSQFAVCLKCQAVSSHFSSLSIVSSKELLYEKQNKSSPVFLRFASLFSFSSNVRFVLLGPQILDFNFPPYPSTSFLSCLFCMCKTLGFLIHKY